MPLFPSIISIPLWSGYVAHLGPVKGSAWQDLINTCPNMMRANANTMLQEQLIGMETDSDEKEEERKQALKELQEIKYLIPGEEITRICEYLARHTQHTTDDRAQIKAWGKMTKEERIEVWEHAGWASVLDALRRHTEADREWRHPTAVEEE